MQTIRARFLVATLILAGLVIPLLASAQSRGTSSNSPCNDELYQQLRNKPRSQMTEVEIRVLERKDKACREYEMAQVQHQGQGSSSQASPTSSAPGRRAPAATAPPPKATRANNSVAPLPKAANPAPKQPVKAPPKAAPPRKAPPHPIHEAKRLELDDRNVFPMDQRMAFAFYGGMAPPSGKLTDYHHVGYTFGVGLAYSLTHRFDLDLVSFGVDHFPLDRTQAEERPLPPPGGSVTVLSLSTGFRARLTRGFTVPYVAAGIGYYRAAHWDLELTPGQVIQGKDWNSIGWTIGAGIERRLGERSMAFTEARAAFASTAFEYSAYYPLRGGVRVHF